MGSRKTCIRVSYSGAAVEEVYCSNEVGGRDWGRPSLIIFESEFLMISQYRPRPHALRLWHCSREGERALVEGGRTCVIKDIEEG